MQIRNKYKVERVPLVSPGIVCYAKKRTSITVQFPEPNGTIWSLKILKKFQTLLVSSCGLKKVSIIVAFHFKKLPLLKFVLKNPLNWTSLLSEFEFIHSMMKITNRKINQSRKTFIQRPCGRHIMKWNRLT